MTVLAPLAGFLVAAAVVWFAGIRLSDTTDVLAERLHLGSALGGLLMLAIATNLPEIAIITSAALAHDVGIAIGNILGGIAIQTVVLVVIDMWGVRGDRPLTYRAANLALVLEASLVIAVLVVVVMASRLPPDAIAVRVAPGGVAVAALWIAGLLLLARARRGLPWQAAGDAPDGQQPPRGHSRKTKESAASKAGKSTAKAAAIFGIAAVATLVGGVMLERTGESIAQQIHMTGVLFGATVLAAATSLPEISTGLTSARMGDYQLAVSDIFGGNAFLPVLFLLATILSGQAVIPQAQDTDIYLTGLGALLTAVYIAGLIFRPTRRILRMGIDSTAVLGAYAIGLIGLFVIANR